jgi:hypothetical protein
MAYAGDSRRIDDAEVDAFCDKLARWAEQLEPNEQALATVLLTRARRAREIDADFTYEGRESWIELVNSVFRGMVKDKTDVEVTTDVGAYFAKESGPSWVKGAWVETNEADAGPETLAGRAKAMTGDPSAADAAATVPIFAESLKAFAGTLPQRERELLQLVVLRAMDPLERVRWASPPDVLDDGQEALLQDLDVRYEDK